MWIQNWRGKTRLEIKIYMLSVWQLKQVGEITEEEFVKEFEEEGLK